MISTECQLSEAISALRLIESMFATPGISVTAAAQIASKSLQRLAWAEEQNAKVPGYVPA